MKYLSTSVLVAAIGRAGNEGRYRHYKGKEYLVFGVATHSETLEEMVLYRQDYGERGLWVRPKEMFLESVEIEVQMIPRFLYAPAHKCSNIM